MQILDFLKIATLYHDPIIKAIFFAVIVDIVTGLTKAVVYRRLNSTTSTKGLAKNICLVIAPAFLQPVFVAMGAGSYWSVFTLFILSSVVLSISENWIALGLPFPDTVAKYIDTDKINEKMKSQNPKHQSPELKD